MIPVGTVNWAAQLNGILDLHQRQIRFLLIMALFQSILIFALVLAVIVK